MGKTKVRCSAYGYIRVSDARQAKSGLGLAAQRKAIEEYYRRVLKPRGILWGGWFVDKAVSASKKPLASREQGAKLIEAVHAGDHIVIAKIDRGFRNLHDFAGNLSRWKSAGSGLHLLDLQVDTTTPVGELIAHIMASVAQWESRRIGERIREAKVILAARGYSTNGRPKVGFCLGKNSRIVPDPRAKELARTISAMRRKRLGWKAIAAELNRLKVARPKLQEKQPGVWTHQAAQRLHAAFSKAA